MAPRMLLPELPRRLVFWETFPLAPPLFFLMKQAKFLGLRAVFYGTMVNDQAWSSARGLPARFLTPHEPMVG